MTNTYFQRAFYFWFPLCFLMFQVIIECTLTTPTLSAMHNENGSHELLQFFILLGPIFLGLCILVSKSMRRAPRPLSAWIALATLSCVYIAGEEVSWGQHIFDWKTPEDWAKVNDQGETNIHNTSSWLDQRPRLILEIGAVIGGIIIPLLLKYKPHIIPAKFSMIYPTMAFALTAGILLALKLVDKLDAFDIRVFTRASEVQEIYLYYFFFLYMTLMKKRVNAL